MELTSKIGAVKGFIRRSFEQLFNLKPINQPKVNLLTTAYITQYQARHNPEIDYIKSKIKGGHGMDNAQLKFLEEDDDVIVYAEVKKFNRNAYNDLVERKAELQEIKTNAQASFEDTVAKAEAEIEEIDVKLAAAKVIIDLANANKPAPTIVPDAQPEEN